MNNDADKPTDSINPGVSPSTPQPTSSSNVENTSGTKDPSNPTDNSSQTMPNQPPSAITANENTPSNGNLNQGNPVSNNFSSNDNVISDPIIGPHSSSGNGKGFKIFLGIGILIALVVWAGVIYLFLQNKNLKNGTEEVKTTDKSLQVTPTPEFNSNSVKIKQGNVVYEQVTGEDVVLVGKEDYPSTGITGFLKVAVSPNNKKICFESWSPAPEPALYLSSVDGKDVKEVSPNRQNCLWSKDSNSIFYTNVSSKTAPVNIFKYDILQGSETDLTGDSVPSGVVRRFEIVGLSADGSKLICKYENIGGAASTETMSECEIDLENYQVNSL